MNCDEFSREFDILWNNATSNQAPSLNSYEKSVFLTRAQHAIIIEKYKGITDKAFELTEEVASYLSPIIRDTVITKFNNVNDQFSKSISRCNNFVRIDAFDNWFILYESALVSYEDKNCCDNEFSCSVIPTTYDRFDRMQRDPFKRPNDHRIFRLNIGFNSDRDLYLVYPKNGELKSYQCTYIKRPKPIILEDLRDAYGDEYNLSIEGISSKSECELGSAIHNEILIKAVDLAKITWTSTIINSNDKN